MGEYRGAIATRQRLDAELVRRGLAASRSQARQLIDLRRVRVNGSFADKPARLVDRGDAIEVIGDRPRFVGRGGAKLAHALAVFDVDVAGRRCIDAGASTGGFTDCLLQHGAREVVAIDVGYGQLHESLVGDARVRNLERTNIRHVDPDAVGGAAEVVVADLSFISLRTVLPALVGLVAGGGELILLVKPQFEAGRADASRGRGVIRDPTVWRRVLVDVGEAAAAAGAPVVAATLSPVLGGQGNVEFLYHLRPGADPAVVDVDDLVDRAGLAAGRNRADPDTGHIR